MSRLILVAIVLIAAAHYFSLPSPQSSESSPGTTALRRQGDIDQDEAIRVAQQHALKANVDLTSYAATACEVPLAWRVYLEPLGDKQGTDVLEYLLIKNKELVLATNKLSGRKNEHQVDASDQLSATISRTAAIAIARKEATRITNLANKQLTVCELKSFWKIIYTPPIPLDGGGPEYLIDKKTGRITDRKAYQ